jgi:hypothetical protein
LLILTMPWLAAQLPMEIPQGCQSGLDWDPPYCLI